MVASSYYVSPTMLAARDRRAAASISLRAASMI